MPSVLELNGRPLVKNEQKIPKTSSFLSHLSPGGVGLPLSEVIIVPKSAKSLETNVSKTNRQKALVIKVYYGCVYLIAIIISCINFQTQIHGIHPKKIENDKSD